MSKMAQLICVVRRKESMKPKQKVIEFLMGLSECEKPIVAYLTKKVLQLSGDIREEMKWNALCYLKGDRAFIGIMPYKKYISVIFDRGAELNDPYRVLEGKGHTMRHIKIYSLNDLEEKHVDSFIEQSYNLL
jgi:hypothetical protein